MRSLNTLILIGASHRLSHACDARSHDPGNSQCSYSDTGNSLKVRKTSEKQCPLFPCKFPNPAQCQTIPKRLVCVSSSIFLSYTPISLRIYLFPTYIPLRLPYPCLTHSSTSNYIVFILSRYLRVFIGFDFVIELAGFNSPLIHLTSVISRHS